jgi:uncharacterized repeat protein (TIGR03803 family)
MQFGRFSRSSALRIVQRIALAATLLALKLLVMQAHAQTYSVIHNFSGGGDGATPYTGLTIDRAGNLYGTTYRGATANVGTVYRLRHSGSNWILDSLYAFRGGASDGSLPLSRVVFGPDGSLYGTASFGGHNLCGLSLGCGIVYQLRPPVTFCRSVSCPWRENVLYFFGQTSTDGATPSGELAFDHAGNLYGTTQEGGTNNEEGVLYQLARSGNNWTQTVIHNFGQSDGSLPFGGVAVDGAGNLYGTTVERGMFGFGSVFQFTPTGSGWTETLPYSFQGQSDGQNPRAGILVDPAGNLFGATAYGGPFAGGGILLGGTAFELSPSGGGWTLNLLFDFPAGPSNCPNPGASQASGLGPWSSLTMDAAGNLYGTTLCDGASSFGNVFKLTPSDGGWTYTSLYDFTGGTDGAYPLSNVTMDASGNLYGTASAGGSQNKGVVWEITP